MHLGPTKPGLEHKSYELLQIQELDFFSHDIENKTVNELQKKDLP